MKLEVLVSHAHEHRLSNPDISDNQLEAELRRFIKEYDWGYHAGYIVSFLDVVFFPIAAIRNIFASYKHDKMIKSALEISKKNTDLQ